MNGAALKREKRELRRRVLAERDTLTPDELASMAERIADRIVGLPELAGSKTVLAFWSFGSEVPTRPLLDRLVSSGHRLVLPGIVGGDLELRSWSPGDPMSETSFGALEPVGGTAVDPRRVDVIVTPAVAFDRRGGRIGYGGGFYDRLFRRVRADAFRVGIAASRQVLDRSLPRGSFDEPVHAIVTEREVIRPARKD